MKKNTCARVSILMKMHEERDDTTGVFQWILQNFNPFSPNFTKWSNTLKQFVGNLLTDSLSMFDDFAGLALKGLRTPFL